jgi:SAM-dependent methyltransferase
MTKNDIVKFIDAQIEPSPLKSYVYSEIERIHKEILSKIDKGIKIDQGDLEPFVKAFFQSGQGEYVGIESNLPSSYYKIYPTYLSGHKKYIDLNNLRGKRILIEDNWEKIYQDALMNPGLYKKFIQWHQENKVDLMWISKSKAKQLCKDAGLDTTDIGLWSESYAVTFRANSDGTEEIKMIDKKNPLLEKVKTYVCRIIREASIIPADQLQIPILPEDVAREWEGYVGELKKRENTIGKLLLDELGEYRNFKGRILDAAAGVGHEVLFLFKNNFDISANELDYGFSEILLSKIPNQKIETYQYDWRELLNYLKPMYKAIVLIGNSLSMVKGNEERKKCIEQFYKLLASGGKLIIDQRNFELIQNELSKGNEYLGNGIMYPGTEIISKLTRVNLSNLFAFNFFVKNKKNLLGTIVVEAIPKDELKNMLKEVGFKNIKVYSDLEKGLNPKAHFYTYVATK